MDLLSSCILIPCLYFLLYLSIQAFISSPKRLLLPPRPKPFPVIGNLLQHGNKPHLSLTNLAQRYGPVIDLKLGQKTTVLVSSSTVAKGVLRTQDKFLHNRTIHDAIQACDLHQDSLPWTLLFAKWRNLRKICNNQLFAMKILDANQAIGHLKVQELIADVNESVVKGKVVEIERPGFKTTLNLFSHTIVSIDLAEPRSEVAREFKDMVWIIMEETEKPNFGDYFPLLRILDPQSFPEDGSALLIKLLHKRWESRKSNDYVTSNDMLDSLLNISEVSNDDMDRLQIKHKLLLEDGVVPESMNMEKFSLTLQIAQHIRAVPKSF